LQPFYFTELSIAYGDAYDFQAFAKAIQNVTCEKTKLVLENILLLHGNNKAIEHSATLRANDYMTEDNLEHCKKNVMKLCLKLRSEVVSMIDCIANNETEAFGGAIGHTDGKLYERFTRAIYMGKDVYNRPKWWKNVHAKL
jgi:hypothetical protein